MKKDKLSTYFVFISAVTLITVLITIVQHSYSNLIGPVKKAQAGTLLKNIDPNLDIDTLLNLESLEEYSPQQVESTQLTIPVESSYSPAPNL